MYVKAYIPRRGCDMSSLTKHGLRFIYPFIMKGCIIFFLSHLVICITTLNAQDANPEVSGMKSLRKNSVYFEFGGNAALYSVNYDRIIPLTDKMALVLRVGGNEMHSDHTDTLSFNFLGTAGILRGSRVHFFESSLGYTHFLKYPDRLIAITAGYRLQGRRGLVIRVTPMYIYNTEKGDTFGNSIWFGVSAGYSF